MYCVLTFLVLLLLDLPLTFTEEGSSCIINSSNEKGVCKLILDCPYAQDLLRNRLRPQICSFSRKDPIVCCLLNSHNQTQSAEVGLLLKPTLVLQNTNLVRPRPDLKPQNFAEVSDENVGELSRNKCLTYYPKPLRPIFVTGGAPSLAKEFPHMAIIGYGKKEDIQWLCGGSLISKKYVLTAAHCLSSKIGDPKFVRLGDLDLSTEEDNAYPEDFTIAKSIPHPLYQPPIRYHDIALLELDREVALSAYVSPACLNTDRELNVTSLTATGWGKTDFRGNSSSFLMKVDLNYVPNDRCIETFGKTSKLLLPNSIVDELQLCAGGLIGQDTCQGDSGGPLQIPKSERTFTVRVHSLIGVTSFGKACGLSKAPGIYTRISNYLSWIESIAWVNESTYSFKPLN